MTDTARVIQVIETTITRGGTGTDDQSPMRVITQYWSPDGHLLAESDPRDRTLVRWQHDGYSDDLGGYDQPRQGKAPS